MKHNNERINRTRPINGLLWRALHLGDSPFRELRYGALPTFADVLRVVCGIAALMADGSNRAGRQQRPLGETRTGP